MKILSLASLTALLSVSAVQAQNQHFIEKHVSGFTMPRMRSESVFLPLQERQYEWNLANVEWDSTVVRNYRYSESQLDTVLLNNPVSNALESRELYTWSPLEDEVVFQQLNGSTWENFGRTLNKRDSYGYQTGTENYVWENGAWAILDGDRIITTYTGDGKLASAEFQNWDASQELWASNTAINLNYSQEGNFLGYVIQVPSMDGTLEDFVRIRLEYSNPSAEPDTAYIETFTQGNWEVESRYTVSRWANLDDPLSAQPVDYLEEVPEFGGYVSVSRATRSDLAFGGFEDFAETYNQPNWEPNNIYRFELDQYENVVLDQYSMFFGEEPTITSGDKYTYTYDSDGNILEEIQENFNQTEGIYQFIYRSVYTQYLDVTGIKKTSVGALSIFPNPAANSIQVRLPNEATTQLEVISLDGRVQQSLSVNGTAIIDLSALAGGCYIIRAIGDSGVITSTVIKQ